MLAKRSFRADVPFFCLLSLVWVLFFICAECNAGASPLKMVSFSLGAGVLSYILLKWLGYFDPIRLLPRKSNLFILPIAVGLGGYLQYMIFAVSGFGQLCGLDSLLFWTPLFSLLIFGGHFCLDWHRFNTGQKRRIVLNLSPVEREIILQDFATLGNSQHFQFLDTRDLSRAIHENQLHKIDLIITSENGDDCMQTQTILVEAHVRGIAILDYRLTSSAIIRRVRLSNHNLWSYVVNATQQTALLKLYSLLKPIVEPVIALLLAVVLAPLMVIVAIAVRATSTGPALFVQTRTGFRGTPFKLVKFRSMYVDAEKDGVQFATKNDSRITPLGAFLRKTRLDELPQLWNVIRGDMSFIGPRPERPEIYAKLQDELPMFWIRTMVKPGVTGWAQVYNGYVASLSESKTKLEFDLYYIQHRSPRLDLIIILKTIVVALFRTETIENPNVEAMRVLELKQEMANQAPSKISNETLILDSPKHFDTQPVISPELLTKLKQHNSLPRQSHRKRRQVRASQVLALQK